MEVYEKYPLIENFLTNIAYVNITNEYKQTMLKVSGDQEILIEETMNESTRVLLFCMGGLNSHSGSAYVASFVSEMIKKNYKIFIVNHRGIGSSLNEKSTLSIHTDDKIIDVALNYIRSIIPNPRLYACGVSLGSHIITNYISGNPDVFIAFVSFSNYFCPFSQIQVIESSKYLNYYVVFTYINLMRKMGVSNSDLLSCVLATNPIRYICENLLFHYHDKIKDWKTFFDQSNLLILDKIKTPCLFVNSENDLFTNKDMLHMIKEKYESSYLHFIILKTGSHVGYSKEQMRDYSCDFFSHVDNVTIGNEK